MQSRRPARGQPLRILFIGADLSTGGGVNKVVRDLAVLFTRELDAEVTVVGARNDAEPTYSFPSEIRVERYRPRSLPAYFALLCKLRRRRFDVVISPWTQDNILVALAFARSGAKVILVEHAPWHFHGPMVRWLRRLTYPLATAVVTLNRHDLDHYKRFLRNVRLIPNPVSAPAGEPDVPRERLVLAVGHLEPLKQFDHALRAMARSDIEQQGWSLAIIGSGSCEEELRAEIDRLGLKGTTILPPQNLGPWYEKASILLLPSRLESFSLVLCEAMSQGVVPLAYATDGPSMILEEFPAQLVRLGHEQGLADALRALAAAPVDALRTQLAKSIQRRFSPDIVMHCWKELLGDSRQEQSD